jgi:hypothetical protein
VVWVVTMTVVVFEVSGPALVLHLEFVLHSLPVAVAAVVAVGVPADMPASVLSVVVCPSRPACFGPMVLCGTANELLGPTIAVFVQRDQATAAVAKPLVPLSAWCWEGDHVELMLRYAPKLAVV